MRVCDFFKRIIKLENGSLTLPINDSKRVAADLLFSNRYVAEQGRKTFIGIRYVKLSHKDVELI